MKWLIAVLVCVCAACAGDAREAHAYRVYLDGEQLHEAQIEAMLEGAARWNTALGWDALQVREGSGPSYEPYQIYVGTLDGTSVEYEQGETHYHAAEHQAEIYLVSQLTRPVSIGMAGVAEHELGHALGLAHTADVMDVMHSGSEHAIITDADLEAVENRLRD